MPSPDHHQIVCKGCDYRESFSPAELLARLQLQGLLRRQKEPPLELILELVQSQLPQDACPQCGATRLEIGPPVGRDDEWERPCARCSQAIPEERLELFPDAELCVACQQAADRGEDDDPIYCPRCGDLMRVRSRGGGLARYELVCGGCGR